MKIKRISIYVGIIVFAIIIIIGVIFINNKREIKLNEIDQAIIDLYENESFAPLTTLACGTLDEFYGKRNVPERVEFNGKKYCLREGLVDYKYVGDVLFIDETTGVTVYSIKYVTSDFAFTIKDKNKNYYYAYTTEEYNIYSVDNMEEFLKETGFYETSKSIVVSMSSEQESNSVVYYKLEDVNMVEYVMNLMKDVSVEANNSDEYGAEKTGLSIIYNMDSIEKRIFIDFYENGNMEFNCSEHGRFLFNTGEKGIKFATELIEYLGENCSGQIYKWD